MMEEEICEPMQKVAKVDYNERLADIEVSFAGLHGDIVLMREIVARFPECGRNNAYVCGCSAEGGNLECLKLAIEIGGILSEEVIRRSTNDVCTIYAVQQKCPYEHYKQKVKDAYRRKFEEIRSQM
jgi:hypothetical protein